MSALVESVYFSIVVVGDITAGQVIEFAPATACFDCGDGVCDRQTMICNCTAVNRIGQSCQNARHVVTKGGNLGDFEITLAPLETLYVVFQNDEKGNKTVTIRVHSFDSPVALRLFVGQPHVAWGSGLPFEFDEMIWDNASETQTWERTTRDKELHVMIRNDFNEQRKYKLSTQTEPEFPLLLVVLAAVGAFLTVLVVSVTAVAFFKKPSVKPGPAAPDPVKIPE
jgi:hypothetical protein